MTITDAQRSLLLRCAIPNQVPRLRDGEHTLAKELEELGLLSVQSHRLSRYGYLTPRGDQVVKQLAVGST